jgi:hypothetical protein
LLPRPLQGTRKFVEIESSRDLGMKEIEVKQGEDAVALPKVCQEMFTLFGPLLCLMPAPITYSKKESNKIGSDAALYECCYMEETATELIEVESNITKVRNELLMLLSLPTLL